ncbi:PREDICTED: ejaculatory bulb-specific protein 3-like isoform X2 [Wasmannia auropunctata]|nr:PREDICTED: ejaculatory bulb-specific protein 3-like isoform X2 [Wasmannia auropunctata]
MKLALLCLLAIISVVYVYAADDKYTDKFDNIDVDQILNNDRLLKRYIDCLLDKPNVRCPAEAIELKKHITDALDDECSKCSEHQKEMVKKVIKHLIINKRSMWNELKAKYDPEGNYAKKYEDMAKEEGVQI